MTATRPPDVDTLARRLPRPAPSADRALAMRRALLDAADPSPPDRLSARRWYLAVGLAAAAAVAAVIVWRALDATPRREITATSPLAEPAVAPRRASDPVVATAQLAEGATTLEATHPIQLTRGDTTITAPAGARLDVEVRNGQVLRVAVKAGWVVISAQHAPAKMVIEHESWAIPAPTTPPAPTSPVPSATSPASTLPASSPPSSSPSPRAPSTSPASTPSPTRSTQAARTASTPSPASSTPSHAASTTSPSAPPASEHAADHARPAAAKPPAPLAAEQAFRDGLRALFAGDPHKAIVALDRACGLPSSAQADACYWAGVAWLRSGDRDHARRALGEVLIRFPGSTHGGEASVALGWLLLDAGDRAGARARFAAAADDRMPSVRADAIKGLAAAR